MGVVYHANYLVWFEVGRVELMRQLGLSYKRMEQETGCGIAVVEATCRYKAPARYDEELDCAHATSPQCADGSSSSLTPSIARRMKFC